jgi:DNA-binding NtrC family response regulator
LAEELLPQSRRMASSGGHGAGAIPLGLTLEEATQRYIKATVDACDGNRTEAAKRLGVGRNTVGRALKS